MRYKCWYKFYPQPTEYIPKIAFALVHHFSALCSTSSAYTESESISKLKLAIRRYIRYQVTYLLTFMRCYIKKFC